MIKHFGKYLILVGITFFTAAPYAPAANDKPGVPESSASSKTAISARTEGQDGKNSSRTLSDFKFPSYLVAKLLQDVHFAQHQISEDMAKEWITMYMQGLDYNRMYFTQADQDSFMQKYAPGLPASTANGDLTAADEIYQVFQQRLKDRYAWIQNRFKKPFDFTADEYFSPDRSKASWPKDNAEADTLWNGRLKYDILGDKLTSKKPNDALKDIQKRYDRTYKLQNELEADDLAQIYLSALASVYDPHSQYLSPDSMEDFNISIKLSLFGIGAVLTTEDGYCTIKEIVPGGPADLDKRLKENDKIVGVAQGDKPYVDVVDMKLRNAVKMIRGEKGSVVRLNVIPADATDPSVRKEVRLVRDKINLSASRAKGQIIDQPALDGKTLKVGVIDISSFYGDADGDIVDGTGDAAHARSVTSDVLDLINQMKAQNIDGLIIDLRKNGGGLLDEAIRLSGLFIDKGPVVQVKDQKGKVRVFDDEKAGVAYKGPLLILTSRQSASASEIFAGAMQNYGRAVIVGDASTHGKGTVQAVIELSRFLQSKQGEPANAGALKLTIQQFYLPNGSSTQNKGVVPDVSLPSPNDYLPIGEASLPHALPWAEVSPATGFKPLVNQPADWAMRLREASQSRVATNPDYKYLREDIDQFRLKLNDKRVSLNENKRLEEKKEKEASLELRKKERLARGATEPKSVPLYLTDATESDKAIAKKLTDPDDEDIAEDTSLADLTRDLHLLESLRILADWMALKANPDTALVAKKAPTPAS